MKEFDKNTREKVRIFIEEYAGKQLLHIRVFYQDLDGEWKPTKKGISLRLELAEKVLRGALDELKAGV
ncbi:Transcriptional Coactivator p15 (PC4) (plasmid) [Marinitoga piezophila KA3]|uniref:Transcriptional Coactivator p15 (PC4) n=1 Tax=Marinitoga piezophila (strain DSM 14283 / JCM 11233 / KA3) TaxID=443254 RepID=H2J8G4_MARPK|nr:transcriptional coactivator p15/PC4 family protein [Marinitoga piezophila]AEX86495.1 Transcriptional Coactivator p15 (PC4) [Marinitoga piezophila KA3]